MLKDLGMETEESLVPALGFASGHSAHSEAPKTSKATEATGKSKRSKRAAVPLVAAAKQRAKTIKLVSEGERLLEKAATQARHVLEHVAPNILDGKSVDEDPTLELIRARLRLVEQAMDQTSDDQSQIEAKNKSLYELAIKDPYLKDCESTLLATPEDVMTVGSVRYCRNVLMDLNLDSFSKI